MSEKKKMMKKCVKCGTRFEKGYNYVMRNSGELVNVCPNCGAESFYNEKARRVAADYLCRKCNVDFCTAINALGRFEEDTRKAERWLSK